MLNHLTIGIFVLLSMGLLADCYHGPGTGNCGGRPVVPGSVRRIWYGTVQYKCVPPALYTGVWVWNCATGTWNGGTALTCPPPGAVNGGWGLWTAWGNCNPPVCPDITTSQTRTRLCNNPTPGPGGAPCVGPTTETMLGCSITVEPVKCPHYFVQTCDNVLPGTPTLCASVGVPPAVTIVSSWISAETSPAGTCVCGVNFGFLGNSLITYGGCMASFHYCYH